MWGWGKNSWPPWHSPNRAPQAPSNELGPCKAGKAWWNGPQGSSESWSSLLGGQAFQPLSLGKICICLFPYQDRVMAPGIFYCGSWVLTEAGPKIPWSCLYSPKNGWLGCQAINWALQAGESLGGRPPKAKEVSISANWHSPVGNIRQSQPSVTLILAGKTEPPW